ncbi:hypothetical protein E2562_038470 [Oryza meyeriana var. granulata]|uniref:Uncharacterized protein n=1 Tax=Oryza meyeriana var. granulata TaxID=110450 RepID=A0A6G1EUH4_9ORYZ|nr:hypothetical protein E2562_038470 [Oryza meyeriana var. granulata]
MEEARSGSGWDGEERSPAAMEGARSRSGCSITSSSPEEERSDDGVCKDRGCGSADFIPISGSSPCG